MRIFGIHPTTMPGGNTLQKPRGTQCESATQTPTTGSNFQVLTPASADQLERRFSNKSLPIVTTSSSSPDPNTPTCQNLYDKSMIAATASEPPMVCEPQAIKEARTPSSGPTHLLSSLASVSLRCSDSTASLQPALSEQDIYSLLMQAESCLTANEASRAFEMTAEVLEAVSRCVSASMRSTLECQAHITLCKALVQLGECAHAFHACKHALTLFPMQHELLYLSGKVLLECGQPNEAVAFFGYAIEAKPDHLPSWLARGLTYHVHLKDFAHAVSDFHTSIVLNPTYYKSFFYMGLAMSDLGRFDLALEAYGRSIHLNATFSESYFRRGVLHLQHHRLEEAVADFSTVTQLVPESAEAHYNCALAQHLLKRNEDAIQSYTHCLKYQPSYINALKNCAHAQSELGFYTEAFEKYSTALTLPQLDEASQLDILLARGQVSERNQDFDQALADYTRAIALRPSLGRAFTCRGLLHLQRAELTLALSDFTQSIALEPDNARAWNNRGTVRLQRNELIQALADFDRALELCPTLPKALRNRGKALYLLHQLSPALQTLNTALQTTAAQHDPEISIFRGLVHRELGLTAKALKDFGRAPETLRKRQARLEQTELLTWLHLDFGTTTEPNS